jgi:hypothetical protein
MDELLLAARAAGLGGARLFGYAGPVPPHAGDLAHAAGGLVALGAGVFFEAGMWGLGVVLLSGAARALGLPSADLLLPRRPSWAVLLRPPSPRMRRLVAAPADRPPVAAILPRVTLAALIVAFAGLAVGTEGVAVGAVGLAGVAGVALWFGRDTRADRTSTEAWCARAAVEHAAQLAASGDEETAVAVCGGSGLAGHGVAAILDWWGRKPGSVELDIVGSPAGAGRSVQRLGHVGWTAKLVDPMHLLARSASPPSPAAPDRRSEP